MSEDTDDTDHKTVEVRADVLRQAIGCLAFDSRRAYQHNATSYADIRHGTGRTLAEAIDMRWTEIPEIKTHVPEETFAGLDE